MVNRVLINADCCRLERRNALREEASAQTNSSNVDNCLSGLIPAVKEK